LAHWGPLHHVKKKQNVNNSLSLSLSLSLSGLYAVFYFLLTVDN